MCRNGQQPSSRTGASAVTRAVAHETGWCAVFRPACLSEAKLLKTPVLCLLGGRC